jgi:hypothetical protein
MMPLVAKLFTTAAIVVISGIMLAQSGDRLADLTGIGRVWTGSFLVGLPHLFLNSVLTLLLCTTDGQISQSATCSVRALPT